MGNASPESGAGSRTLLAVFPGVGAAVFVWFGYGLVRDLASGRIISSSMPFAAGAAVLCVAVAFVLARLAYLLWTDRLQRHTRIVGPIPLGIASFSAVASGIWVLTMFWGGSASRLGTYVDATGLALVLGGGVGLRHAARIFRGH